ncbi:homocysteine S-methyltransferase family protein [Treponema zioleckii]|uniref:homocysteine S-methyltransferase family protein n=1 Tax=Treponema zioleckii TaxID=331680 RepID=UPI00168A6FFC|nr:homocysteine S-methyltransferase family protein [Treponema zioleckii]
MQKKLFKDFLKERVQDEKPIFFDGGMGTMIQATGIEDYDIPEDLSITHPEIIKSIHRQYLDAGANVITANTFGINPLKLENAKYSMEEYIKAEMKILLESIEECEADGNTEPHYAAWDSGQIGRLLEPMGDLSFDEAYDAYKLAATTAEKYGAELAILETMSDLHEMKAAILAVKENTSLAIVATPTFQENLRTLTGADVLTCVTYLEALRVDVLGFNCGGSLKDDAELARQFCAYSHTPVLVQPNAGIPTVINGKAVFLVGAEKFAEAQKQNWLEGVSLLGGCCGTTPEHIGAMKNLVLASSRDESVGNAEFDSASVKNIKKQFFNSTFVCSYNSTVQIGGKAGPQIVGERINPTGKKKVKAALQAHDMNFVLEEAESQINAGAQILDVNVGLPGIDEAQTMVDALTTIQSAFNVPLQLDSSEAPVLEKGLRYYNGKALINSVNGRQDVMDKVLPLVKHYGGSVVALCIDENGIAPTAEGRCEVARKIIREAAKYDIPVRDIVIDTLTLTVSSQQKEALETCRAISILKDEYGKDGLQFILGVSNISFGLPRRDIVNSRFFAMALYSGLSACIINPLSEPMMETYYGYRALAGYDENCLSYIEKYNGTSAPVYGVSAEAAKSALQSAPKKEAVTLSNTVKTLPEDLTDEEHNLIETICKGFKDSSPADTKKLLDAGKQPVDIIDRCIVPALDLVGKDFEVGKKFLPQLLLSADTVSASFAVIKAHMEVTGVKQEEKGKIVIATVFGDIHDIGKNIVKAMLENYGYTVLDLGKNVPYETVVNTVLENDIQLVGLSALMTTTVGNMETTIKMLREALSKAGKSTKIMAGGAVLTADYATQIGADYYAKDAMSSVAIAKEVFGN